MLGEHLTNAVLDDYRTAAIDERLRAMLAFIEKLTLHPDDVDASDIERLREADLSDDAIDEATQVCAAFNVIDRVADALNFEVLDREGFRWSARTLLKRGYL